tara:strand:+ start:1156 stop:1890 length:735 start_codon:yes stop_codon:yes gene_type:complete
MNNCYIKHHWKNNPVNIAHFFHDNLFHAIVKYIENNSICWILDNDLSDWEYQITKILIDYLNINYKINDSISETPFPKAQLGAKFDRNIRKSKYFNNVIKIVRSAVFNKYNLERTDNNPLSDYKVLYFRNDASRRKIENYDNNLNDMFDEIVIDMATKTFEEQVKLFNKMTHFVTIEGAHLTNILFMNPNAKILIFSPIKNSWQLMFGTSMLVNKLEIITTGGDFHSNIKYNEKIENEIKKFLT